MFGVLRRHQPLFEAGSAFLLRLMVPPTSIRWCNFDTLALRVGYGLRDDVDAKSRVQAVEIATSLRTSFGIALRSGQPPH